MALYAEMQERQLRPDSYTLTALLTACERVDKWQQALRLFEEAVAAGVRPAAINYNSLIFTLGKGGQWPQVSFCSAGSCRKVWKYRPGMVRHRAAAADLRFPCSYAAPSVPAAVG